LRKDGTVVAWGRNDLGQLGDGTKTGPPYCDLLVPCSRVPVEVGGLKEVVAIASGEGHDLALRKDGTVVAWGRNDFGQLGDGTEYSSDVPVEVGGLNKEVVAIAGGAFHSLALRKNGTVVAWGGNDFGQLGDGTETGPNYCLGGLCSEVPVEVEGLKEVVAIAGGGSHSLALRKDGTVVAWGLNNTGQLGDGNETNSDVPVEVSGLKEVVAIAGGEGHSLALAPAPADLFLENSASPSAVLSGKTLTYTLTVTNGGGETASEVKLKDQLPDSAVFKSLHATQGACTRTTTTKPKRKGGLVSCNLGSLEGGKSATITIAVTATKPGIVNAKAVVTASNVTSDTDDEAPATTTVLGD
jgi:uncharacterized repeat protein (TIGR01451 family)